MHVYYEKKSKDIIAQTDVFLFLGRDIFLKYYDCDFTNIVLKETRENNITLLNDLPYIGGDINRLTTNLIGAAIALALYQSMRQHGKNAEDTARIYYEVLEYVYDNNLIPVQKMTNAPDLVEKLVEQEKKLEQFLQKREYAENWMSKYVAGTGTDFHYGRDYQECGIVKLLKHHHADDLIPYMCLVDYLSYKAQHIGLTRTKTLAHDNVACDFRFILGSEKIKLEAFSAELLIKWGKLISTC